MIHTQESKIRAGGAKHSSESKAAPRMIHEPQWDSDRLSVGQVIRPSSTRRNEQSTHEAPSTAQAPHGHVPAALAMQGVAAIQRDHGGGTAKLAMKKIRYYKVL